MSTDWYYTKNDEKYGPFELSQIADLVRSGAIDNNTLVWNEEIEEWKPAHTALPDVQEMPPPIPNDSGNKSSNSKNTNPSGGSQLSSILLQVTAILCGFMHLIFVWNLTMDAAFGVRPLSVVLSIIAITGDFILHKKPSFARWFILIGAGITALIVSINYPSLSDPVRVLDSGEWVMRDYGSMMIPVIIFTSAQIILLFVYRYQVNSYGVSSS